MVGVPRSPARVGSVRRFVAGALVLASTAGLGTVVTAGPVHAAPSGAACGTQSATAPLGAAEQEFVDRLNDLRRRNGRSTLVVNSTLSDRAREWSVYMADRGALMHARTSNGIPQSMDYVYQVGQIVPRWTRAAENVGYGSTPQRIHDAFVASSGHLDNMVGDHNQVGVGVETRGQTIWVTVRFAKGDLPAPIAPSVAPSAFTQQRGGACVGDLPLSGDFDGNGVDDVLLYGMGSTPDGLLFNTTSGSSRRDLTINGRYEPFVADFDGDGRSDIMWYAPGSAGDYVWYGRSDGTFTSRAMQVNGDYRPLVGDYDADGRADIFWYVAGTRPDYFWYSTGTAFRSVYAPANGSYAPLIADFDGNGHDDIFWYAAGRRPDFLWYNRPSGVVSKAWPVNGSYEPAIGDFDDDGSADIFWYAAGSAPDFVWYLRDRSISSYGREVNGDYELLVGDYDGSGTDDLVFFSSSTASDTTWLFGTSRMDISSTRGRITGAYNPAVGDYNGDGRDDIYWRLPRTLADESWLGR